ncbi:MAG: hypothetical protein ABIE94_01920 [archaeon]
MKILTVLMLVILLSLSMHMILAVPGGPTVVSSDTETVTPKPAANITTAGGSFTTLILNATTQTDQWKAYVGNITGSITLDDADNNTIYDWALATITGEVYASRNNNINWTNIQCADAATIAAEDVALSHDPGEEVSINRTFVGSTHESFIVSGINITQSDCQAIATYVNDSAQSAGLANLFQEVLLEDGDSMIYATILEQNQQGYDLRNFDFQMIVAEDETSGSPTTYWFYAELG